MLQSLSESLGEREGQLEELRAAAEPLQAACSPEVAKEIEAVVSEAVAAWEDTVSSLQGLCDRYHHAVELWQRYQEVSQALEQWTEGVNTNLEPDQAVQSFKVRARHMLL